MFISVSKTRRPGTSNRHRSVALSPSKKTAQGKHRYTLIQFEASFSSERRLSARESATIREERSADSAKANANVAFAAAALRFKLQSTQQFFACRTLKTRNDVFRQLGYNLRVASMYDV